MSVDRKAKVTPETVHEAKLLTAIWENTEHPKQAVFGEMYEIGNQSAVGQFLRGETPLSLKAAAGFATGLRCKISDFSPRLAQLAMAYADVAGAVSSPTDMTQLNKLEMQLVLMYRDMTSEHRDELLQHANKLHNQAKPGKSHANPFAGVPGPASAPKAKPAKAPAKTKRTEGAEH